MSNESKSSPPAAPRRYCKGCGYSLFGLKNRICPECGRAFNPANRRTFAQRPPRGWVWRWGRRVLAVVLLLLLATGAGLLWLWWGWQAEQPTIARLRMFDQKFTVAAIGPKRLRRVLGKRWDYLAERVDSVELRDCKSADVELELKSLSQLESLLLYRCRLNNSTASHLADFKKLQTLALWNVRVEQADMAFLEKLPALSRLEVRTRVDHAVLENVGHLKHLKLFSFDRGPDSDFRLLQGLSSLEELWVRGPVFDEDLEHLQRLKSLRVLWIDHRLVGSQGVASLKAAIPGLRFLWYN
jgi:hypothetical protein